MLYAPRFIWTVMQYTIFFHLIPPHLLPWPSKEILSHWGDEKKNAPLRSQLSPREGPYSGYITHFYIPRKQFPSCSSPTSGCFTFCSFCILYLFFQCVLVSLCPYTLILIIRYRQLHKVLMFFLHSSEKNVEPEHKLKIVVQWCFLLFEIKSLNCLKIFVYRVHRISSNIFFHNVFNFTHKKINWCFGNKTVVTYSEFVHW